MMPVRIIDDHIHELFDVRPFIPLRKRPDVKNPFVTSITGYG
jgi:hypothetical protein